VKDASGLTFPASATFFQSDVRTPDALMKAAMSTDSRLPKRPLPDRPNLHHLKDQAKDLLKAGIMMIPIWMPS
jgi:hypothetical protein